jgi:hypothetical protein
MADGYLSIARWSKILSASSRQPAFLKWKRTYREAKVIRLVLASIFCVLCMALLSPSSSSIEASARDFVFALYFPVYDVDDWSQSQYFEIPALGQYGTDDSTVAATHIAWAKSNNIDGFLVSWDSSNPRIDEHLRKGFLSARNIAQFKFIILYESSSLVSRKVENGKDVIDFHNEEVRASFMRDMEKVTRHFWHPSYFSIDSRPIVVLRHSRHYVNFECETLAKARKQLGIDVYFVSDAAFAEGQGATPEFVRRDCHEFDAYTAIDMHSEVAIVPGESALTYHERVVLPIWARWSLETVFFPLLTPKFNVYGLKTLTGNVTEFWTQIRAARSFNYKPVSMSVRTLFFVRSFNHWYEGSNIEPSRDFGYDLLNAVSMAFSEDVKVAESRDKVPLNA